MKNNGRPNSSGNGSFRGRPSSASHAGSSLKSPTSTKGSASFINSFGFEKNVTLNSSQQQLLKMMGQNANNLDGVSESEEGVGITLLTSFLAEGERYMKTREWEKAIDSFTKALEDEPTNKYAFICRSKCYTNVGLFDKAIEDAEKALEIDPKYHRAFLAKAEC